MRGPLKKTIKDMIRFISAALLAIMANMAFAQSDIASATTYDAEAQIQSQQCGGTIIFRNKSAYPVYLYGTLVSKYNPSNIHICDYWKGVISPNGGTMYISVTEGTAFSFHIYSTSECLFNNIKEHGVFPDCHAVGQYHDIH
jgi:hypothetical protein